MNSKQRRTLEAVFATPTPADVRWRDIESLLQALGAETEEGSGSRVAFLLNGVPAVFHRPHPRPEAGRATVRAVRRFLELAGIEP